MAGKTVDVRYLYIPRLPGKRLNVRLKLFNFLNSMSENPLKRYDLDLNCHLQTL
jgi:hypothetical protein